MEVPVTAQEYIEQGNALLWRGQPREAAAAFAHAAQSDPNLIGAHLGLAQTSVAMGSYGMVHMACRRVQELEPTGPNAEMARALVLLLDRRYDRALEAVERAIATDPGRAYAHALRGYILRQTGRGYEAALAEAKSERLAGPTDFLLLFPRVAPPAQPAIINSVSEEQRAPERREPIWQPPSQVRRNVAQARFITRSMPVATFTLIGINVLVFLMGYLYPQIYDQGVEVKFLVVQEHEYWRVLTAMFLHAGWLHIGLNMLSLYFIGPLVERVYGTWRFLLMYFVAGLFGGVLFLLLVTNPFLPALGASGAIFGIFGALGTYFWQKRYAFGSGVISQWLFWLIINMVFTFGNTGISVSAHIGGLAMGLFLGLVLLNDFWVPVRTRLKRNQTSSAIIYALKPIVLVLAVAIGLILLAYFFGGGR